ERQTLKDYVESLKATLADVQKTDTAIANKITEVDRLISYVVLINNEPAQLKTLVNELTEAAASAKEKQTLRAESPEPTVEDKAATKTPQLEKPVVADVSKSKAQRIGQFIGGSIAVVIFVAPVFLVFLAKQGWIAFEKTFNWMRQRVGAGAPKQAPALVAWDGTSANQTTKNSLKEYVDSLKVSRADALLSRSDLALDEAEELKNLVTDLTRAANSQKDNKSKSQRVGQVIGGGIAIILFVAPVFVVFLVIQALRALKMTFDWIRQRVGMDPNVNTNAATDIPEKARHIPAGMSHGASTPAPAVIVGKRTPSDGATPDGSSVRPRNR
ncbi:MAG: hypothetical protein V4490_00360, partial [Pseudomonadota bacterium]